MSKKREEKVMLTCDLCGREIKAEETIWDVGFIASKKYSDYCDCENCEVDLCDECIRKIRKKVLKKIGKKTGNAEKSSSGTEKYAKS